MHKNVMLTALLIAVLCQPVSAVSFFAPKVEASMVSKAFGTVRSFVRNQKIACATVGVGALLVGGYNYLSKVAAHNHEICEKQLEELIAEVKNSVAQDTFVSVKRIKEQVKKDPSRDLASNLWPTIKKGKYVFLDFCHPEIIKLANKYMRRMNDLLDQNMTHDARVIAHYKASRAAYKFNQYALRKVLYKFHARLQKEMLEYGWTVSEWGIKTHKPGNDACFFEYPLKS